jgi:hypothetical protein
LKGSELVNQATRKQVQAAACEIGLNINSLVGEWMAHVRNPENPLAKEPLVYLSGHSKAQYAGSALLNETWEGARRRAGELGFSIRISYNDESDGGGSPLGTDG